MAENESEVKHLRGKVMSFQIWMERQIALGLLDIENTPLCFDRSKKHLEEMAKEHNTLKTTCFHCDKLLGFDKYTEDHVRYFCNERCYKDHFTEEEKALRHQ